ncbi:LysE family translocator [Pseudoroseomonas cervicalis]|uniref:Translocator protein, LysE family n=1 Tax=Pseudoroseomonas cervicalis ATCC 49957 TaxID=525371 RepID=D5RR20_9PROT|nr:LysE family translocator [Pseudoroseomonas cervicalis]EFH10243.1 translocator protein, LysE family [Pseudoroseomonas cervicalis ATCC 49957]
METLPALLGFAIAASVTPGPNTLMIAAIAAQGGWRRALPAMLGVTLGFTLMLVLGALGLAAPLAALPWLQQGLRWLGAAWLLWLAWRIGTAPPPDPGAAPRRLPGFWAAAALQWVNPKAWLVALAALASFARPGAPLQGGLAVVLVFALISMPCLAVWAALGAGAGRRLATPRAWRLANAALGLLMAASILPLLL